MNRKKQNNGKSVVSEDFKFIADASLGRLAKWLRLLGYDTAVFHKEAGREMLRMAQTQGRIVLTRRGDMTERQFSGTLFLIQDITVGRQLRSVIEKFSLKIDRRKMFGICIECNEKLYPVEKENIRDSVPPFVFQNCDEYHQCPRCQRIYWAGTHQRNIIEFMKRHIPDHLP